MRQGERVELIKKIADRLSADDYSWDDRGLVLHQFGFPTGVPDDWSGTDRAYVIWVIEDAADEMLLELSDYLFGRASGSVPDPANLPWQAGTFRLFVSHTSGNAQLAGKLHDFFAPWRIDAFVAHSSIEPTREWERVIEAALRSCQALAVLVSQDFVGSRWCDQEVGYGLGRGVPIVPVRLGVDPHGFIAKFQAARVARPYQAPQIADGIFRALAGHPDLREQMVTPVVHRFAATRSFDGARANFSLLQAVPAEGWTRDLVELAEKAIDDNSQLRDAYLAEPASKSVPEATRELLAPVRRTLGIDGAEPTAVVVGDDDIPF